VRHERIPANQVARRESQPEKHQAVYLDVRTGELGPNLLNEFDRQLTQQLAKSGITAKVLRFRDSEPGKQYSFTSTGMQIPEITTDYRLVIFPSQLTVAGAWRHYDVRWDLMDARNGKLVWSTQSKTIVDGIIAEMQKSSLL